MAPRKEPDRRRRPGSAPGRPAARAGARPGRPAAAAPATPRARFTHRMAVLVLVVAVLVVSYASSLRAYLDQRSHLADLRQQIASSEDDIAVLEREKRRWKDDAYVEAQARERFGWVMPGETSYQVIGRDGEPLVATDALPDPDSAPAELPDAWWSKVWGSMENADHPERVRTPVGEIEAPSPPADDDER